MNKWFAVGTMWVGCCGIVIASTMLLGNVIIWPVIIALLGTIMLAAA